MKNNIRLGLMLASLLMVFGCSSSGPKLSAEKPEKPDIKLREYNIGIGDLLQVSVWRNPDLSLSVPVRPDGKISIPLAGDVEASGISTRALSASISEALKSYIKNPQVTVIVTSPESVNFRNRVRVTGALNAQISLPYRDGMTVLDVVLDAGGPNEFASGNRSRLYRNVGGEVKVYPVLLDDILKKGLLETNYELLPADIVTVPERAF